MVISPTRRWFMLKALELVGFKSFADSTRFDFPPGISVVVGPNGSGKSNVVDAVKWVFGEQSVKSLRGTEMVDVVFNGSVTRPPAQSAEATLVLDNSSGRFPLDTPEVEVTRRVYRSGEGEYLINRRACRRRDVVELFAGTGLGTHAFCIIEQGKVDQLLQASPRDRRVIFEEAAGISRFKAKKLETERRLERVDQNLLRLSDIVQEVEARLKTIRLQAGKAARYRYCSDRLLALRTQVASVDWRNLKALEEARREEVARCRETVNGLTLECEALEARGIELDVELGEARAELRASEARAAQTREWIAAREALIQHERERGEEAAREAQHWQSELEGLAESVEEASRHRAELEGDVESAGENVSVLRARIEAIEREVRERQRSFEDRKAALESLRQQQLTLTESMSECLRRVSSAQSRREAAASLAARLAGQIGAWERQMEHYRATADASRQLLASRDLEVERHRHALAEAESRLTAQREIATQWQEALAEQRRRYSVACERAALLEDLDRRQEGLHVGVKELLLRARTDPAGPLGALRGIVADLFRVRVELAPIVEAALGERAQFLVASEREDLLEFLVAGKPRLQGRVGFVWLDARPPSKEWYGPDFTGLDGVVGRADRLVDVDTEFVALASRLLGRTWVVRDLSVARSLLVDASRTVRCVTLSGEVLDSELGLIVGPAQSATGLISRRSELGVLRQSIASLVGEIERMEMHEQEAASGLAELAREVESCRRTLEESLESWRMQHARCEEMERRLSELHDQRQGMEQELAEVRTQERACLEEQLHAAAAKAELEEELTRAQAVLARAMHDVRQDEIARDESLSRRMNAQVELVASERAWDVARSRMEQAASQCEALERTINLHRERLLRSEARCEDSRRKVNALEEELAALRNKREAYAREISEAGRRRHALEEASVEMASHLRERRGVLKEAEVQLHAAELRLGEAAQRRQTLEERLAADFGIDAGTLAESAEAPEAIAHRESIDREIEELRRELNKLGPVNMEALEELDSLESRFAMLSGQYDDLVRAKGTLERIIERINTESRRLFAETLQTIRGHFEELFRRLFGGGAADLALEEGVDILESGIDIVARPPGKQLRGISLLSGGEKTLTCVALLLAFFKSRPSPFCVLDEVDAALDEANIGRFIEVIQGFLHDTQFIVVTHSKRTMVAANTLYGVTMQESGVSKRVSVRFEDVSNDGQLALPRAEQDAA